MTLNDVHKMNEDQLQGFKHILKQFQGDLILREISDNVELYGLNRGALDLVADGLVQVLARKNPP
jgi:hypothetical protein